MADDDDLDERAVHLREEGRLLVERCREMGVYSGAMETVTELVGRAVGTACLFLPRKEPNGQSLHPSGPPDESTTR